MIDVGLWWIGHGGTVVAVVWDLVAVSILRRRLAVLVTRPGGTDAGKQHEKNQP
jgi:hypothetical protein